jgi:hypothetical protein
LKEDKCFPWLVFFEGFSLKTIWKVLGKDGIQNGLKQAKALLLLCFTYFYELVSVYIYNKILKTGPEIEPVIF